LITLISNVHLANLGRLARIVIFNIAWEIETRINQDRPKATRLCRKQRNDRVNNHLRAIILCNRSALHRHKTWQYPTWTKDRCKGLRSIPSSRCKCICPAKARA